MCGTFWQGFVSFFSGGQTSPNGFKCLFSVRSFFVQFRFEKLQPDKNETGKTFFRFHQVISK